MRSSGSSPSSPGNTSVPDSINTHMASDEGKLEFRTETILVQVTVVITDKSGTHIHGLNKDNFRVLENGKEQTISTFEEVVATNTKFSPPAAIPGEFSNLTLSENNHVP